VIDVRVSIPLDEYWHVKDDLEAQFEKHGIIVALSAETVIRTWAMLMFDEWFDNQDCWVDHYIGWGEIGLEYQDEPMLAACSCDFVDEGSQPRVVMNFCDEPNEFAEITEEDAERGRNLALLFKLAHGGR
jgi:hypothetical protein